MDGRTPPARSEKLSVLSKRYEFEAQPSKSTIFVITVKFR